MIWGNQAPTFDEFRLSFHRRGVEKSDADSSASELAGAKKRRGHETRVGGALPAHTVRAKPKGREHELDATV